MKKRLLLLLLGFIVLYYLMHIAYLFNNRNVYSLLPGSLVKLLRLLADMGSSALFTLVPYLLLKSWYPARKIIRLLLVTAVLLWLSFLLNYFLCNYRVTYTVAARHHLGNQLFFFFVYFFYGIIFYFSSYAYDKELEQRDLALQNRQSELSFLRSQVNPHFIFNSLNNIYSLVYEGSPRALPAIAGLSELMRYTLYEGDDKVPLEKEMTYIQQYIELQLIRFDHPVKTNIHVSGATSRVVIPALLLIPFVENAFKHGDFTEQSEGLAITLYSTQHSTQFYCRNNKGTGERDGGGGIGLANVRRRLELLYPGRHRLDIEDTPDSFTIHLELTHE